MATAQQMDQTSLDQAVDRGFSDIKPFGHLYHILVIFFKEQRDDLIRILFHALFTTG